MSIPTASAFQAVSGGFVIVEPEGVAALHQSHVFTLWVTLGPATSIYDGSGTEHVLIGPTLIAPDVPFAGDGGREVVLLYFDPETLGRGLYGAAALPRCEGIQRLGGRLARWLRSACEDLRRCDLEPAAAEAILHRTVQRLTNGEPPRRGLDGRVGETQLRMLADLGRHPSLEELAGPVGISGSRLRHLFREQTGLTLRAYGQWLRSCAAFTAIAAGGKPAQIASQLGFSDQSHMCRALRRWTGLTASTWGDMPMPGVEEPH